MVDSILTNQAPIVTRPADNRSVTGAAVSNASTVPEVDLADDIITVSPRTMDTDADQEFSSTGRSDAGASFVDVIRSGSELRPPLENFRPIEVTSERALENRIADINIRENNNIDESDTIQSVNNRAIKAFETVDAQLQQSVDMTA